MNMNKRKRNLVSGENNYMNYNLIRNIYTVGEVFNVKLFADDVEVEYNIQCDIDEAEKIIDGAMDYAKYSDRFEIVKEELDDNIEYTIIDHE